MLDIDYVLETDKGLQVRIDTPLESMKHNDGNVFLVQGPSSMGKSSIMNMIAIGCFGESNDSLSESVRSNLRELTSARYRKLTFDITLENPKNGVRLIFHKGSGRADIMVTEEIDGTKKVLSADTFRKRYNLIYDVPELPTKRLEQIRDTIRTDHRDSKLAIGELIKEIRDVRSRIKEMPSQDQINDWHREMQEIGRDLPEMEDGLASLKKAKSDAEAAYYIKAYQDLSERNVQLKDMISREESKPAVPKSSGEKRVEAMKKYREIYPTVRLLPRTKRMIADSKNEDLIHCLRLVDDFDFEREYLNVNRYSSLLMDLYNRIPNNEEEIGRERLVNEIIRLLRDYKDKDAVLGAAGSVEQLLEALDEYKRSEFSAIDFSPIKKEILDLVSKVRKVEAAARKLDVADDDTQDVSKCRDESKLRRWREELNANTTDAANAKGKILSLGINFSKLQSSLVKLCLDLGISQDAGLEDFKKKMNECLEQFRKVNEKIQNDRKYLGSITDKYNSYLNMEKPKFYDDRDKLSKILDACNQLRSRIDMADDRLTKIINHDKSEYERSPELYEPFWSYIGSKLEKVTDCGVEYRVESVDLLDEEKGTIKTKEGMIIAIGSMGTGEGQLSYLRGLLTTGDDRKIVALFDEVGNMSNNLVRDLTGDFKRLNDEGKLMLAFMARPTSDEFEVVRYD